MTDKLLFKADSRGIATLTFNRPERRNAYDQEVLDGITHHCKTLGADPNVRAIVLRALAVTGRTRSPQNPQLPTMIESGVPNLDFETWVGEAVGSSPEAFSVRYRADIARYAKVVKEDGVP